MAILDNLRDLVTKAIPQKKQSLPVPGSTGVGHGVYRGEDLILRKSFIVAGSFQIFLAFIAMCCFAGVASFQARFKVGPSALSVIAIFDSLILLFLASFLLAVPVIYDKYDKLKRLARALQVIRVAFICNGIGVFFSLLTAFITTISVFTQAGCKDPKTDESARTAGKDFVDGLPQWCQTKRAGAVFFWLAMIAWLATTYLTFQEWRTGKTIYRPEDPPFALPSQPVVHHHTNSTDDTDPYSRRRETTEDDEDYDDARSPFADTVAHNTALNTGTPYGGAAAGSGTGGRYAGYGNAPGRPSMDAYGAFSDPNPSGYGGGGGGYGGGGGGGGIQPYAPPEVSKTMQYADAYAAVTASIHSNTPPPRMPQPPPFGGYQR